MALFKAFAGTREELDQVELRDGYAYVVIDEEMTVGDQEDDTLFTLGEWYIDAKLEEEENEDGEMQLVTKRYRIAAAGLVTPEGNLIVPDELLRVNDDTVAVNQGGTGLQSLGVNNIILGNGTNPVKTVAPLKGALYAAANGAEPQFGTVPVSIGGTGGETAEEARTNLDVYSKQEVDEAIEGMAAIVYTPTLAASNWARGTDDDDKTIYTYTYRNENLRCGVGGTMPPIITYTENLDEYSNIDSAEATPGQYIVFTIVSETAPEEDIKLIIIDLA